MSSGTGRCQPRRLHPYHPQGHGVLDRSSNWPRTTRRFTEWSGRTANHVGRRPQWLGLCPPAGDRSVGLGPGKDTQDKDTQDSSGNNHASRVRSDGALIQMADRDDSMLYVYELPTKAAMESMDPTWADIRIFKPSGLDLGGARAKHFDIDQGHHRCQVLRRPRASITGQYADSNAANHGVTGQPGTANVRGMYDSSGGGCQPFGRVGHIEDGDPSTRELCQHLPWPDIRPGRECGNAEHAERKTADWFLAFLVAGALVSLLAWVFSCPTRAKGQAQPALDFTDRSHAPSAKAGGGHHHGADHQRRRVRHGPGNCTELCRHGYPERLHG